MIFCLRFKKLCNIFTSDSPLSMSLHCRVNCIKSSFSAKKIWPGHAFPLKENLCILSNKRIINQHELLDFSSMNTIREANFCLTILKQAVYHVENFTYCEPSGTIYITKDETKQLFNILSNRLIILKRLVS